MDPVPILILILLLVVLLALLGLADLSGEERRNRDIRRTGWEARREMDQASREYLRQVRRGTRR